MIQNFFNNPIVELFFLFAFIGSGMHLILKLCKLEKEAREETKERKYTEMLRCRNQYLVESLISYLKDTDQINDFCEDRDIQFYDFEYDYYELVGYIDPEDILKDDFERLLI